MRLFKFAIRELGIAALALCEPCRQAFDPVPSHPCSHGCARPQRGADQSEVIGGQSDSVVAHGAYGTIAPRGRQSLDEISSGFGF